MPTINKKNITQEANEIKTFIETNKKLPNYCTIQGNQYTPYTVAYLISRTIANLKADTFNVKPIGKSNVDLTGVLKNTASITLDVTEVTVATLPTQYRPTKNVYEIMQGSGTNIWLLGVNTAGQIKMARYRANTTSYSSIRAGAWFPIHCTWIV